MSLLLLPTTNELWTVLVKAGWGGVSMLGGCCVSGLVENWISPHLRQNPATWPHLEHSDQPHWRLCWHSKVSLKTGGLLPTSGNPLTKKSEFPNNIQPKIANFSFPKHYRDSILLLLWRQRRQWSASFQSLTSPWTAAGSQLAVTRPHLAMAGPSKAQQPVVCNYDQSCHDITS